jgi:hypothetical protein
MYNFYIDFNKLVIWLLPTVLRKPKILAYLNGLVTPLKMLYNSFLIARHSNIIEVITTPQVYALEMTLNDLYDVTERRIYIEDDEIEPTIFLHPENENRTVFLPVFLPIEGGSDFVVKCPLILLQFDNAIKSVVTKYKLPSKKFRLEYY